jgi:heptose-I-phosphate ethanolaminephosphotransferase
MKTNVIRQFLFPVWLGIWLLSLSILLNWSTYPFSRGIGIETWVTHLFLVGAVLVCFYCPKPRWLTFLLKVCLSIWVIFFTFVLVYSLGYRVIFDHNLPLGVLVQTFQTNGAEIKEAFSEFVSWKAFLTTGLLAVGSALWLYLLWKAKITNKWGKLCWVGALILCVLASWAVYAHRYKPFAANFYLVQLETYYRQSLQVDQLLSSQKNRYLKLDVYQSPERVKQTEIYVVVIGESLTKCHMGGYGYERDTTPELSRSLSKYVLMTDVVSPDMYTEASLRHVLTLSSVEKPLAFFDPHNFNWVEMAKRAGFTVSWISNQRQSFGPADVSSSLSAELSDFHAFTNNSLDVGALAAYDEVILPIVEQRLKTPVNKHLIVIHIYGNHGRYEHRYPPKFAHFSNNEVAPHTDETDQPFLEYINQYDNSVFYNDWLIAQITSQLFSPAVKAQIKGFMYFSDHGDDPSRPRNLMNQSSLERIVGIPLLIRVVGGKKQEEWMNQAQNRKDVRFMSDDLIYLLADMMGLKGKSLDMSKSPLSNQFHPKFRNVLESKIDFDSNVRSCWDRGF